MSQLASYDPTGGGEIASLLQSQQALMLQMLQGSQAIQHKIAERQQQQEADISELQRNQKLQFDALRTIQNSHKLITVNMLETMLGSGWDEPHKNLVGRQLAKFSKEFHVTPVKVPHPVLPNGVNAYEPGIVKAWLEENNYEIPADLRYVN